MAKVTQNFPIIELLNECQAIDRCQNLECYFSRKQKECGFGIVTDKYKIPDPEELPTLEFYPGEYGYYVICKDFI